MDLPQIVTLAKISACIALGDEKSLRTELEAALAQAIPISLIREAILQSYLFAGYAAAINAFILLNEFVSPGAAFYTEPDGSIEKWTERGVELCRKIYGDQFDRLRENMKRLHPDLADWMIWEGYGKVLARPFLTPRVRELLIVAMTGVLQVERQFYSHVRGALHVGATPEELHTVFEQVVPHMDQNVVPSFEKILHDLSTQQSALKHSDYE